MALRFLMSLLWILNNAPITFTFDACPHPGFAENSVLQVKGLIANYECEEGYHMLGQFRRACENGSWFPQAPACGVDIALGKPTFLSTETDNKTATFATDGLTEFLQNDLTCTDTEWEPMPWIIVDLLQVFQIDAFNITKLGYFDVSNSSEATKKVLSFEILIGNYTDNFKNNAQCVKLERLGADQTLSLSGSCNEPLIGRFAILRAWSSTSSVKLGICKVQLLSKSAFSPARCPPFGRNPFEGRCLGLYSTPGLSWAKAQEFCQEKDGHLIKNIDKSLQVFLAWEMTRRKLQNDLWILLKQETPTADWLYPIEEKRPPMQLWGSERTNWTGTKWPLCAAVDASRPDYWTKVPCHKETGWICEFYVTSCGQPSIPENVSSYQPLKTTYSIGDVVSYTCENESISVSRMCMKSGKWSRPAQGFQCKTASAVSKASSRETKQQAVSSTTPYILTTTTTTTTITTTSTTSSTGGNQPCSAVSSLKNGLVNSSSSRTEFKCQPGFRLIGATVIKCINGTWDKETPICEKVSCPVPSSIEHGQFLLSPNDTSMGTNLLYSCSSGYTLQGLNNLTCLPSGQWNGPWPYCSELQTGFTVSKCNEVTVANGDVMYLDESRRPGARVLIRCHTGFHSFPLSTYPLLICLPTGHWNATVPSCDKSSGIGVIIDPEIVARSVNIEKDNDKKQDPNWVMLIGSIVGVALFIAIVGAITIFITKRTRRRDQRFAFGAPLFVPPGPPLTSIPAASLSLLYPSVDSRTRAEQESQEDYSVMPNSSPFAIRAFSAATSYSLSRSSARENLTAEKQSTYRSSQAEKRRRQIAYNGRNCNTLSTKNAPTARDLVLRASSERRSERLRGSFRKPAIGSNPKHSDSGVDSESPAEFTIRDQNTGRVVPAVTTQLSSPAPSPPHSNAPNLEPEQCSSSSESRRVSTDSSVTSSTAKSSPLPSDDDTETEEQQPSYTTYEYKHQQPSSITSEYNQEQPSYSTSQLKPNHQPRRTNSDSKNEQPSDSNHKHEYQNPSYATSVDNHEKSSYSASEDNGNASQNAHTGSNSISDSSSKEENAALSNDDDISQSNVQFSQTTKFAGSAEEVTKDLKTSGAKKGSSMVRALQAEIVNSRLFQKARQLQDQNQNMSEFPPQTRASIPSSDEAPRVIWRSRSDAKEASNGLDRRHAISSDPPSLPSTSEVEKPKQSEVWIRSRSPPPRFWVSANQNSENNNSVSDSSSPDQESMSAATVSHVFQGSTTLPQINISYNKRAREKEPVLSFPENPRKLHFSVAPGSIENCRYDPESGARAMYFNDISSPSLEELSEMPEKRSSSHHPQGHRVSDAGANYSESENSNDRKSKGSMYYSKPRRGSHRKRSGESHVGDSASSATLPRSGSGRSGSGRSDPNEKLARWPGVEGNVLLDERALQMLMETESFEMDHSFVEPVELRSYASNSRRLGTSGPRNANAVTGTPRNVKHASKTKLRNSSLKASSESDFSSQPTRMSNRSSRSRSSVEAPSMWDAKKFKNRNKKVQFKESVDEYQTESREHSENTPNEK